MHYYKHHIGDYARSTSHLSFIEHGIYRLLLDAYYESERALEADLPRLMRRFRIRTASEKRAFLSVLDEFFLRTERGYEQARCEREIHKANRVSDAARGAALERWGARNPEKKVHVNKTACMQTQSVPSGPAEQKACATDAIHHPISTIQRSGERHAVSDVPAHRCAMESMPAPYASRANTISTVDNGSFGVLESPDRLDSAVVTPFDF